MQFLTNSICVSISAFLEFASLEYFFSQPGIGYVQGLPLLVVAPHFQSLIPSRVLNSETLGRFILSADILSLSVNFGPFGEGLAGGDRTDGIFGEQGFSSYSFPSLVLWTVLRGGVLGGVIFASVILEVLSSRLLSVEDMAKEESVVI